MTWKGRDILSIRDFSREEIEEVWSLASQIEEHPEDFLGILRDSNPPWVTLLFLEPSTRTYHSFHRAAINLGCNVDDLPLPDATSRKKGESSYHTAMMFDGWNQLTGTDNSCIVTRHSRRGGPKLLAERLETPVINGGDSTRGHPTQAMLDGYTFLKDFGGLDRLKIGISGDLRYGRTPSSLASLLTLFDDVIIYFIAPDLLQISHRPDATNYLDEMGLSYELVTDPREVMPELDALYVTRIQKERMPDKDEALRVARAYTITPEMIAGKKDGMGLYHPLPIIDEITPEVEAMSCQRYFQQAANGLPIRMALLYLVLRGKYARR